jgi:hypothetical protein
MEYQYFLALSPGVIVFLFWLSVYLNPTMSRKGKRDDFYKLLEANGFRRVGIFKEGNLNQLNGLVQINEAMRSATGVAKWFLEKVEKLATYLYVREFAGVEVEAFDRKMSRNKSKASCLRVRVGADINQLVLYPNRFRFRYFRLFQDFGFGINAFAKLQKEYPLRVLVKDSLLAEKIGMAQSLRVMGEGLRTYNFMVYTENGYLILETPGMLTDPVALTKFVDLLLEIRRLV